jgi:hypothetical protein
MKKTSMRFMMPLLLVLLFPGLGMTQFNLSGEFRMRGEYRDGYLNLRDESKKPYGDILGRARVLFDFQHEKFSTRFTLQSAWVFGQNSFSSDTVTKNTVNFYEAWLKYAFTKNFALKIGRVELVYDDQRFIGASNWSTWGASHDVVVAQWQAPEIRYKGDFGFAVNNIAPATLPFLSPYTVKNSYKYMGYLWEQKKFFGDKLSFSLLAVLDANQKFSSTTTTSKTTNDTLPVYNQNDSIIGFTIVPVTTKTTTTTEFPDLLYARATVGLDGWLNLKKWKVFLTGYYQGGHYRDGRKLNSFFYATYVSFQAFKFLALTAGFDHLGGNDYSDTTELKTKVSGFSTLYGSNHNFYGYMDLFSAQIRDNLSPGLNDLYARTTWSLTKKMNLELTWRWFSLPYGYLKADNPKKGDLPYTSVKKSLGHEIDLMYIYKPFDNFEVNAGYCFFLPTETMEIQRGLATGTSKFAQFAYIMLTYKPNFFSSEKR